MDAPHGEITVLLRRLTSGDREAEAQMIPIVHRELRRLAAAYLHREHPDHTFQPADSMHEAYLRLADSGAGWQDRSHFFVVAARVMRRVLVDHARGIATDKRGGGMANVELRAELGVCSKRAPELLAVDDALERLEKVDNRQARVVELRFFAGLSEQEIAKGLRISVRTARRDWEMTRAWLHAELER